jgi:D-glycero-D-manno-heptose 1,7-bisphosphate phosphatase
MRKGVFLDRDGVLNRSVFRDGKPSAPFTVAELEIVPGVPEALDTLHRAGFVLVVVTNQPDVARGRVASDRILEIHRFMRSRLCIDDIRVCFHDDHHLCVCRKPMPGMLYAAAVDLEIQLTRSFMVGDRWRDVGAGRSAGCRTILVNRFPETTRLEPDVELTDLLAAAHWILAQD